MVLVLKIIFRMLLDHFDGIGKDPRTSHLLLTNSYSGILLLIALYILVVLKIGPQFMAKREPYKIKSIIQIYNIFQIFMNLYIFWGLTKHFLLSSKYSWTCMKYDKSDTSYDVLGTRKFAYLYFVNKILDFLDTIFFVLRKKFKNVSFLHVYHHALMVWSGFVYVNLLLGSQFTVVGYVNSLVHILMYTYYFLSALDTKLNVETWKPYMTKIQILQFFYFTVKFFVTVLNNSECGLPQFWLYLLLIQNLYMTVMFSHFYWKTYICRKTKTN